jgi:hypothetical protein
MFNYFDVFYMFRTPGFIFRKKVVYTVMVRYVSHDWVYAVWWALDCLYSSMAEDKPSGAKHIEDINI